LIDFFQPTFRQELYMKLRTPEEARQALKDSGVSISSWAMANGFLPNMVFDVLAGRRKCIRGQAHNIAVTLGIKSGVICKDPAKAHYQHKQAA
jgi:gp16 family phage-associated protein